MKILVFGSDGQLGRSLKYNLNYTKHKIYFKSKKDTDITSFKSLSNCITKIRPEIIINCAAFTNVDLAEKKKLISKKINYLSVKKILSFCKNLKIFYIHISTDFIFSSKKFIVFNENHKPNPVNYYGKIKLEAEREIIKSSLPSMIIRTSFLYSNHSDNFFTKILKNIRIHKRIYVVDDLISSPTNSNDLAKSVLIAIDKKKFKNIDQPIVFNYSNKGYCSRYEFALKMSKYLNIKNEILPIKAKDYILKKNAIRSSFSILNSENFEKYFRIYIRNWKSSLREEINKLL